MNDLPLQLPKDPDATLDYSWDWNSWLEEGDTIATADVTVEAPLAREGGVSIASGVVTAWISGGDPGRTQRASCKVVTTQGRTDVRSILLVVRSR